MPIYKFRCLECETTFRVLKRNGSKDESPDCPECESTEVEKMISSVGIRFKGSGFYRTDYGGNGFKSNGSNEGKNGDENPSTNKDSFENNDSGGQVK